MSSKIVKYLSPKQISALAKIGNKIRITRKVEKESRYNGYLKIGRVYTITGIYILKPSSFFFTVEGFDSIFEMDFHNGYCAEPLGISKSELFISTHPINEPDNV